MAYFKLIDLVRKFDSGVIELPLMQRRLMFGRHRRSSIC